MSDDPSPESGSPSPGREKESSVPKIAFFLSLATFIFLGGVAVGVYKVFPYGILNDLHDSATAVLDDREMLTGARPVAFIQPARHDGDGVTTWERDEAVPGLTFVSGFFDDDNGLRLMDMDGTVLNQWRLRFSELFPEPDHVEPEERVPTTDWHVDVEGIMLFPDGSAAFNFAGLGLTKVDRCGDVIWQVDRMTHHSLEPSLEGGFWVPAVEYVDTTETNPYRPMIRPYMDHVLLEVSDQGEVRRELSLLDIFYDNDLQALIFANGAQPVAIPLEDPLHLNDIEVLEPSMADAFPDFRAGDLLLSLRDLNLVMVVSPDGLDVRWHRIGPWIRQHDPDFRPDGTISVYNNNTDDARGSVFGGSNVMVVDPSTDEVTVVYGDEPGEEFYSQVRGKHQYLDGGNMIVTEHGAGRFFEVTPSGETVWEYVNRYGPDEVAEVTQAVRYPYDHIQVDTWNCEIASNQDD